MAHKISQDIFMFQYSELLFTKRTDVLPDDLVKSSNREIRGLIFDRHIGI